MLIQTLDELYSNHRPLHMLVMQYAFQHMARKLQLGDHVAINGCVRTCKIVAIDEEQQAIIVTLPIGEYYNWKPCYFELAHMNLGENRGTGYYLRIPMHSWLIESST